MHRAFLRANLLRTVGFLGISLACIHGVALAQTRTDATVLGQRAFNFLKKHCAECHTGEKPVSGVEDYDVLDYTSLTNERFASIRPRFYVKPGAQGEEALKQSYLWRRAGVAKQAGAEGDMPPEDAISQPADKERNEVLRTWLEAGAPAWPKEAVTVSQFKISEPPEAGELWFNVRDILERRCMKCHAGPTPTSGVPKLQIIDYGSLTRPSTAGDRSGRLTSWERDPWQYVKPGQPGESLLDESLLYFMVKNDKMPLGGKLDAAEKAILKEWISAGAPLPPAPSPRVLVTVQDQIDAIVKHLQSVPENDRRHLRFFSFANLHNTSALYLQDLRVYRAALAKLLNSLSWQPEIHVPQPLRDTSDAVLVIDLRKLGWDKGNLWEEILRAYPYGLAKDAGESELFRSLSGTSLPVIRADWFVYKASRPPLYHRLLDLPESASDLEERLGIDFLKNFRDGKVARAGYLGASTTTSEMRVVERQQIAKYAGAYWQSYDFGLGELARDDHRRRNPLRHGLGPLFDGHPFPEMAFLHDGGEVIFNLPNGLQSYLVVDSTGRRVDAPPIWILKDKNEFSGTPQLVNGISCIACHIQGMHSVADQVRQQSEVGETRAGPVSSVELKFVRMIYPPREVMATHLKADEKRFLEAVKAATQAFLADDQGRVRLPKIEPIYTFTARYRQHVDLEDVAHELGFGDVISLRATLESDPRLLRGLGIQDRLLQQGGKVSREEWVDGFAEAANRLKRGRPLALP